jgi:hypothetical protein
MAVTTNDLQTWLAEGSGSWLIRPETDQITEAAWNDSATRAHYLCNRANLGLFHIHDEPGTGGYRSVYFAIEN